MNATRVEFYEWLDTLCEEDFKIIMQLADTIKEKERKAKINKMQDELDELNKEFQKHPNMYKNEEELIEDLKQFRRELANL